MSGVRYHEPLLPKGDLEDILRHFDRLPWRVEKSVHVQYHGWVYHEGAHRDAGPSFMGDLPECIAPLVGELRADGALGQIPDQLTVREIKPGHGYAAHTMPDSVFGGDACIVVLGSPVEFFVQRAKQSMQDARRIIVEPGASLHLDAVARANCRVGIIARGEDAWPDGTSRGRGRCVLLTFRRVAAAVARPRNVVQDAWLARGLGRRPGGEC